jgi:hypothetical protein
VGDASGDDSQQPSHGRVHREREEHAEEKATEAFEDEDLRSTHEFAVDELQSAARARRKDEVDNDDDSDLVVAQTVPSDEDLIDELAAPPSDDTHEEEAPSSTEKEEPEAQDGAAKEGEEKERKEVQDDPPSAEDDDFEDDDSEEEAGLIEASDVHPDQNLDFVSEGYDLPLPFPVKPSDADLAKGLEESRVSKAVKDRTFPQPTPNKPKAIKVRRFNLAKQPPKDESLNFVALVIGAFLAVILLIVFFIRN